jgi:hypothetical protein
MTSEEFANKLLMEEKVAVVPGNAFGESGEGFIRCSYAYSIENIEEALQPFFTTKPELERSGMGFAFMDAFMDELLVYSNPGMGTRVVMTKYIERTNEQ